MALTKQLPGYPGQPAYAFAEERDFTNNNPAVAQEFKIALAATWAASDTLDVTIEGVTEQYTAAGATKSTIAADVAAMINANIEMYTVVEATASADDILITVRKPNHRITLTATETTAGSGTATVTEEVAPAPAEAIPFGRLVVRDTCGSAHGNRLGKLPSGAGDITTATLPLCVSKRELDQPGGAYEPFSRCAGVRRGAVIVELGSSTEPVDGGTVYVGHDVNNAGVFYANNVGNTAALDDSVATFKESLGNGLAVIEVNFR